jgi:hypothetical protein
MGDVVGVVAVWVVRVGGPESVPALRHTSSIPSHYIDTCRHEAVRNSVWKAFLHHASVSECMNSTRSLRTNPVVFKDTSIGQPDRPVDLLGPTYYPDYSAELWIIPLVNWATSWPTSLRRRSRNTATAASVRAASLFNSGPQKLIIA